MVCTVFQVSGTTEKWSRAFRSSGRSLGCVIITIAFQRSQKETAHMCVGDDIGIIDEYETRADTVQVFSKGWYNVQCCDVLTLQVILGYVTHNRQ